jgi:sugar phosphate isomerase/epimerase
MKNNSLESRLAVCSWSLRAATPQELIDRLKQTGICRTQLALDPLRESPKVWGDTPELFKREGIEIVSGMFGCEGEDYTTLESIRATGGLAPDSTWEKNWANIRATADLAAELGLKSLTFHAGFMPHDPTDPKYIHMSRRVGQTADLFASRGIGLSLETGQEEAPALAAFLVALDRPNVGVNFDPANMILYDKGDPVEAVGVLGRWIRSIHVKDARRTQVPGTWGAEVISGTGEVKWPAFFDALNRIQFQGELCIEREAGEQRVEDIRAARAFLETIYR